MQTRILGVDGNGDETFIKTTEGGILATLPQSVLWTAKGYGRQAMATAAVAALVVRPTTVAIATLHNNSGSGRVLVIERAFGHNLVGTANSVYSIWLCLHPAGMAAPTNDIAVRNATNGAAAGNSNTRFDNGATVVDDGWFPWGGSEHTVTITTPGGVVYAEVGGRIMVPETGGISLSIVADVTGATFTCGFHWFEVPKDELKV